MLATVVCIKHLRCAIATRGYCRGCTGSIREAGDCRRQFQVWPKLGGQGTRWGRGVHTQRASGTTGARQQGTAAQHGAHHYLMGLTGGTQHKRWAAVAKCEGTEHVGQECGSCHPAYPQLSNISVRTVQHGEINPESQTTHTPAFSRTFSFVPFPQARGLSIAQEPLGSKKLLLLKAGGGGRQVYVRRLFAPGLRASRMQCNALNLLIVLISHDAAQEITQHECGTCTARCEGAAPAA